MKQRIIYEYKGKTYIGSVSCAKSINDPKLNAHNIVTVDKKNIVAMAAADNFKVEEEEILNGSAIEKYREFIAREVDNVEVVGLRSKENSNIIKEKIKLSFLDLSTNKTVDELVGLNDWKYSSEEQKEQIVQEALNTLARRMVRREWLKDMIENGIEESDFAFNDEEALSDEDKQAFLSEIEKKKDSLKYIGAE